MVRLVKVDNDNSWIVKSIEVDDDQERYVDTPASFLKIAKNDPNCIPMLIYNDDFPVGFFVYGIIEDVYVIAGLMIDMNHQRKGYGKKAMEMIIDEIKKDKEHNTISINVSEHNTVAEKLYRNLGFDYSGGGYFMVDEDKGTFTNFYRMDLVY